MPLTNYLNPSHLPTNYHGPPHQHFQLIHFYFSSPLTCPLHLNQYHSPHDKDIKFGLLGHAYSHQWRENGIAHINTHITPKAIRWARLAEQINPNSTIILIAKHDDDSFNTSNPFHQLAVTPIITIHPLIV